MHTPGHTPGRHLLSRRRHLVSGDTLFPGGPGNTWGDKEAFAQIIDSLETKLFTLPDETRVYPGHGRTPRSVRSGPTTGVERPSW